MRHLIRLVTAVPEPDTSQNLLREYLEARQYASLLTENQRVAFLVKTYGEKLGSKFEAERAHLPTGIVQEIDGQPGETPGEKVIAWLTRVDPTSNRDIEPTGNAQYVQWLAIRYLKGQFLLEDWSVAQESLALFHRRAIRNQLAKKDINAYTSIHDLRDAVAQFRADVGDAGQMIGTMNMNDPALAARMSQPDQMRLFYDGPDFRVIIPLTEPASKFWGRDTAWCTAWLPPRHNQFNNYNARGPLYILIDKETGEKRQFTFDYNPPQFMDRHDRAIDLKGFLREHPNLIQVFGKRNWMKVIDNIGLEFFEPADLADVPDTKLAQLISNKEALSRIPESKFKSPDFIAALLAFNNGVRSGAYQWFPRSLITQEAGKKLEEIAEQKNMEVFAVEPLIRYFGPDHWSDNTILYAVRRGLFSIPQFETIPQKRFANPEFVARIMATTKNFWKSLGENVRRSDVGEALANTVVVGSPVDQSSANDALIEFFPPSKWADATVLYAIPRSKMTPAIFLSLSEPRRQMFGAKYLEMIVLAKETHNLEPGVIPTEAIGRFAIDSPREAAALPPKILDEDAILAWVNRIRPDNHQELQTLAYVPDDERRTPAVEAAINEISKTEHYPSAPDRRHRYHAEHWRNAFARASSKSEFERALAHLPSRLNTSDFFRDAAIWKMTTDAKRSDSRSSDARYSWWTDLLSVIPNDKLEPNLADALTDFSITDVAKRKSAMIYLMNRLGDTRWTNKLIEQGVDLGAITDPTKVPDHFLKGAVAAKLWVKNPDDTKLVYRASDDDLYNAILATYNTFTLYRNIPKDRLTEPLVFKIASKVWLGKDDIPPKLRSRRVMKGLVGKSLSIKDIRTSWRDDETLVAAVHRKPSEIAHIPDGVKWLKDHPDAFDDRRINEFQIGGITKSNGEIVAVTDLPASDLGDGYTAHVGMPSKREPRIFLVRDGKVILWVDVKRGKASFGKGPPREELARPLRRIAELLPDVDITAFNAVGIYRKDGRLSSADDEERQEVDGLQWSETPHLKGKMYTVWMNDKQMARFYVAPSGGWGGSWNKPQTVKWLMPIPTIIANNTALLSGMQKKVVRREAGNITWDLRNVGIMHDKMGFWLATDRKLGKVGPFTIYFMPKRKFFTVYDDKGLAASAIMLKSGALSKEFIAYRISDNKKTKEYEALKKIMAGLADRVGEKK